MSDGKDIESRIALLEKQMAELLVMKRRLDRADIEKVLRSACPATDAYYVDKDSEFVSRGVYCANCWASNGVLTSIDIGDRRVPRHSETPLHHICPKCRKSLEIRHQNL